LRKSNGAGKQQGWGEHQNSHIAFLCDATFRGEVVRVFLGLPL
jgi:hypothetical protein